MRQAPQMQACTSTMPAIHGDCGQTETSDLDLPGISIAGEQTHWWVPFLFGRADAHDRRPTCVPGIQGVDAGQQAPAERARGRESIAQKRGVPGRSGGRVTSDESRDWRG